MDKKKLVKSASVHEVSTWIINNFDPTIGGWSELTLDALRAFLKWPDAPHVATSDVNDDFLTKVLDSVSSKIHP